MILFFLLIHVSHVLFVFILSLFGRLEKSLWVAVRDAKNDRLVCLHAL
jgi:hypothetical protein